MVTDSAHRYLDLMAVTQPCVHHRTRPAQTLAKSNCSDVVNVITARTVPALDPIPIYGTNVGAADSDCGRRGGGESTALSQ